MDLSSRQSKIIQRIHTAVRLLLGVYALFFLVMLNEKPVALIPSAMLWMTGIWFVLVLMIHFLIAHPSDKPTRLLTWLNIDLIGLYFFILNDPQTPCVALWGALMLLIVQSGWTSGLLLLMISILDVLVALAATMTRFFLWHIPLTSTTTQTLAGISFSAIMLNWVISILRNPPVQVLEPPSRLGLEPEHRLYEAAQWLLPFHQRNMTPITLVRLHISLNPDLPKRARRSLIASLHQLCSELILKRLRACDVAVELSDGDLVLLLADTSTSAAEVMARTLAADLLGSETLNHGHARCDVAIAPIPAEPVAIDQILLKMNEIMYRTRRVSKDSPFFIHIDPHIKTGMHPRS